MMFDGLVAADQLGGGSTKVPDDPSPPSGARQTSGPRPGTGRARRFVSSSGRAARASGRGARRVATATSRATQKGTRRLRQAAEAQGAGRTGLNRLIELNAASAFSDALVTAALAGTLFFSVPTDEARGNVALYLALTMLPFAFVAPIIGPFLDRYRHGRRYALGITAAARAFLAWVAADALLDDSNWLYPAALGVLVGQKAYAVTKAAAVPRVLPDEIELVTANSRMQLAATLGTGVGIGVGFGLAAIGDDWPLRFAFLAYLGATFLAIRLPSHVDSAEGERKASLRDGKLWHGVRARVGPGVVRALRANAALRGLSGFLVMFFAFVLREEAPVKSIDGLVLLGIVAAAAWIGSSGGTAVGALLKARSPDRTVIAMLIVAIVATAASALWWTILTVVLVSLVAGFGSQLGRLSLDAVIQRDVPDNMRSNTFARSETLLQLSWVIGGLLGIVLPLVPALGMSIALVVLLLGLFTAVQARPLARNAPASTRSTPRTPG